ncbi:hypothetical protein [Ramlibacter sp.]|uniref:hypothetical protein n=1 Tax=Ramlibacter sp. TaxID=1917967 RepID=UPI002620343D|nr:hypothetical protein [Ramlibacter sp.]MDB5953892.1 hypothetical protein [Ramlibacter sp.]
MATAFLLPFGNLFASLQALAAWFAPRPSPAPAQTVRLPAQRRTIVTQPAKPLRVVRVLEPSAPRTVAGRMVISGRMADVCAELDRLAALEAKGC